MVFGNHEILYKSLGFRFGYDFGILLLLSLIRDNYFWQLVKGCIDCYRNYIWIREWKCLLIVHHILHIMDL